MLERFDFAERQTPGRERQVFIYIVCIRNWEHKFFQYKKCQFLHKNLIHSLVKN